MSDKTKLPRRKFLKQAAGAVGAAAQLGCLPRVAAADSKPPSETGSPPGHPLPDISYPRVFAGPHLRMISFPLGGVAAGSLGLGGRGQLRDWEIFNRPQKGHSPSYAFPAIWVQAGNSKPIARVLEARIMPPYEGEQGLSFPNAPGLPRLHTAKFIGEYPLAHIDFEDHGVPVKLALDAFSPFIPHNADDSGLPVAILRYRVTNTGPNIAQVAIAFSIDNPVTASSGQRLNEYQTGNGMARLIMSNSGAAADDPMQGSFVLAALPEPAARVTHWRGWPEATWFESPRLFWEAFSQEGELRGEPSPYNSVGALCQKIPISPNQSADFTFLLAWCFPNRTPDWCGWTAPPGKGKTIIGNHYATRFKNAWDAAEYTASHLERLEAGTRLFAKAFRESTLPVVVKEAASANLSTLASTTCFRTSDGEFHGFEGSGDSAGFGYGSCTHVWNYETATAFLFPSLARSLRRGAFDRSLDDAGAIRCRERLPSGDEPWGIAAADGQMGQILHAYLDWKLSGDNTWLRTIWPRIRKAIEFAWVPGGWDANREGVLGGAQHNTYDVEFYGPNPMCGIYYLGALRAGEEMARSLGDISSANDYRKLFDLGSRWIDANLFNGEFFIQQVKGVRPDQIAPNLRDLDPLVTDTEHPQYQLGEGCLIDQLIGQYLAEVAGLGPLVSPHHVRSTLSSIYRYNYRRTLCGYDNVERTFALNDEAAMVTCDYTKASRPRSPLAYYAEVLTGMEYSAAALMIYSGMISEAVECTGNVRARFDGEKRNPWDEPEYGRHYARAMASWTSVVALSGFSYHGAEGSVIAVPRLPHRIFDCFWATGTGWGTFSYRPNDKTGTRFRIQVLAGYLRCRSCEVTASGSSVSAQASGKAILHGVESHGEQTVLRFNQAITLTEGNILEIETQG